MSYSNIKHLIKLNQSPEQAKNLSRFFKTGKGQYGEGDLFYGIKVPKIREIAHSNLDLTIIDIQKLIDSEYHEERLLALLILVKKYKLSREEIEKEQIVQFYLNNTKRINNWDLVDLSCDKIIGKHLIGKDYSILFELAKSDSLWEKRISVISTFEFIRNMIFEPTFFIADLLLKDKHDLIHKAVGWMLREIGKREINAEEIFLIPRYKEMPRTMLRYSIEKFPETKRKAYLNSSIK